MTIEQFKNLANSGLITSGVLELNPFDDNKPKANISFTSTNITSNTVFFSYDLLDDPIDKTVYMINLDKIDQIEQTEDMFEESPIYKHKLLIIFTANDGTEKDIIISFNMSAGNPYLVEEIEIKEYEHAHKALINGLKHFKGKEVIVDIEAQNEMFTFFDYDNFSGYTSNAASIPIKELDYKIYIAQNVPCVKLFDKQSESKVVALGAMCFFQCNIDLKPENLKIYHILADNGSFGVRDKAYVYPAMKA